MLVCGNFSWYNKWKIQWKRNQNVKPSFPKNLEKKKNSNLRYCRNSWSSKINWWRRIGYWASGFTSFTYTVTFIDTKIAKCCALWAIWTSRYKITQIAESTSFFAVEITKILARINGTGSSQCTSEIKV